MKKQLIKQTNSQIVRLSLQLLQFDYFTIQTKKTNYDKVTPKGDNLLANKHTNCVTRSFYL